ncbi:MAG: pectate lyase [Prevotella sp.]|nr:pectate lyase [Prevotella sp.]
MTFLSVVALSTTAVAQEKVPAFPGAEGHGRYVTGGRAADGTTKVYHVTRLEDDSKEGSLRWALSQPGPRTIVFDVSGYIDLKSDLGVSSNTTIAGQTAPGEGITLRYRTLVLTNCDNVIIRYIRVRRSQVKDVNDGADATWGRWHKNIILDHCSFSWSIDEVASFYDNMNFTMQWCNVTEALANAGHSKSAHSYGGIWGGKDVSFHHNFIAHVQNRAPRFNGARYNWTGYDKTKYKHTIEAERVDFRNCVMYNWGNGNGCYGGPGGGYVNIVNNYYKAGPGTKNTTRITQISVAGSTKSTEDNNFPNYASRYYINGNYVTAASKPENYDWTDMNSKHIDGKERLSLINGEYYIVDENHYFGANEKYVKNSDDKDCVSLRLEKPIDAGEITTHSAATAYDKILAYCGASLYRDEADLRYVEETKTGTVTYHGNVALVKNGKTYATSGTEGILDFINDPEGVEEPKTASYPELKGETRPAGFDTDGDGIPDEWEIANGLKPDDASDGNAYTLDNMYTNLEVYLFSLVADITKACQADGDNSVQEHYPTYTTAIGSVEYDRTPAKIEYFTLDGRKVSAPVKGISIRKITYSNGRVEADKVLKK